MTKQMTNVGSVFAIVSTMALTTSAAELATKKALTLDVAKKIGAAAEEFAKTNKWKVVIAVVDEGGHLVYFQRADGVQTGSVRVAIRKAETAAAFKRPTKVFEDAVAGGRTALVALPGGMPFEGGVPISIDGQVIGAVGVSDVTAQQDGMIAQSGVKALEKILGR